MSDLMMALEKRAETCCLFFDSLYLNKVLLCFDSPTSSIVTDISVSILCIYSSIPAHLTMVRWDETYCSADTEVLLAVVFE